MRILHILNHCNHGHGNAHVAIDLACKQSSRGMEVAYVSAGGDYEQLLRDSGVKIFYLKQKSKNPFTIVMSVLALYAFCKKFKPDVVHAHMMSGCVISFVVSRLLRFPLVATVHNSFDWHSTLMRLADRIVAVSEAERRALLKRNFPTDSTLVVLNGPNLSARQRWNGEVVFQFDDQLRYAITVCGLHKRKGVSDLLKAFHLASNKAENWRLLVVGDGPDRSKLEAEAKMLGLEEIVEFLGSIDDPRPLLVKSSIFLLASYAEPCSLAVAEARYSGCAVIATAVGGTPELLGMGKHGILVRPGDPSGMADELSLLMMNSDQLAHWRSASKSGSEYLTISRVDSDYQRIYDDFH